MSATKAEMIDLLNAEITIGERLAEEITCEIRLMESTGEFRLFPGGECTMPIEHIPLMLDGMNARLNATRKRLELFRAMVEVISRS